jgi:phenylpyruvate tautomerase PptA (4-oxalocrotonate tautomerase family)
MYVHMPLLVKTFNLIKKSYCIWAYARYFEVNRSREIIMPLVTINLRKGRPPKVRRAIADAVQAALVNILGLPDADRYQLVLEYDPENRNVIVSVALVIGLLSVR